MPRARRDLCKRHSVWPLAHGHENECDLLSESARSFDGMRITTSTIERWPRRAGETSRLAPGPEASPSDHLLGITRLSKSQVSVMARELDEQVGDFRSRPLDAGPYTFLAADALTMKVREGGRVVLVHVLITTGVQRRRAPGDLRRRPHLRRGRCRLAGVLRRPECPRPVRAVAGHLRRPHRAGRGSRGDAAWRFLAALPHPVCGQSDDRLPEGFLGLGEGAAALGL
jgi:Transposase, Mutator family